MANKADIMPEMEDNENNDQNDAEKQMDSNHQLKLLNQLDDILTMCEEKLKSLEIEMIRMKVSMLQWKI
ncbi:hypothetical protein BLA29_008783 [Euroglyphus maynei]|uniref:Uncharacterized protein n=1 Tax=Euroglyphus maynei TaxID=6958 RepID=A0A1Y3B152_EURMA|nr:hypothetical protein BLA29_008783 [Euroglyphus maynei]